MPLYLDDSTVIEQEVVDENGDPIDAEVDTVTVFVTIYDCLTLLPLTGQSWPVELDYLLTTGNKFRVVLDPLTDLVEGQQYKLVTPIVVNGAQTSCTKFLTAEVKCC